jgi:hypothetical protein
MAVSSLLASGYALSMLDKDGHNSLHAEEQTGDKLYLVTVDTRTSMTITRSDITAGLPEGDQPTKCALQMASGETLPVLKEVTLTLGQCH